MGHAVHGQELRHMDRGDPSMQSTVALTNRASDAERNNPHRCARTAGEHSSRVKILARPCGLPSPSVTVAFFPSLWIPVHHPAQDTPKYENDHSTDHWA